MRSETENPIKPAGVNANGSEVVWLAVVAAKLNKGLGFTCNKVESDEAAFISVLRRFKLGKTVAHTELPEIMWCSKRQITAEKIYRTFSKQTDFVGFA